LKNGCCGKFHMFATMSALLLLRRLRLPPTLATAAIMCLRRRSPARPAAAPARCFASGGMFDSLSSSMSTALKKLLGRKTLTKQEVDVALKSVSEALVDADVAQVSHCHAVSDAA
jgi:hypothetical protein